MTTVTLASASLMVFPVSEAVAAPARPSAAPAKPTASQIRQKLNQLNIKADHLVDDYNQARVDVHKATRAYHAIHAKAHKDAVKLRGLRSKLATIASVSYQTGDMTSTAAMFASGTPQGVLDRIASITHLSRAQIADLQAFLRSQRKVLAEDKAARHKLSEAKHALASVRSKRHTVQQMVAKQKHLLAELPPVKPPTSSGGNYTGPATGSARAALQYAYSKLGDPYQYGAAGPSAFDCSGLTMMAWRAGGVSLPRTSEAQYSAGPHVTVSTSTLQPGDLIFYNGNSHVAIYVGGGDIIQAPHTGAYVEKVAISGGGTPDGAIRP